jgi:hypothetical protein
VISDDETVPGETWKFLKTLARSDARVKPIMNAMPHGACSNHNAALKAAPGEWIKILHDDDVLKPNCLEVLARIVRRSPDVIAVSCACESFWDGKLVRPFYRRDRAVLECRSSRATHSWQCISSMNQGGRYRPNKWSIARLWKLACSLRRQLALILSMIVSSMPAFAHEVRHLFITSR